MGAAGWSVGLLQLVVASGSVFHQQQQQKPRPGILIILAFLTVEFSEAWHRTVARSFREPSLRLLLRPRHRRVAPSCRSISVMTRRFGVSAADCSERGGRPSQSAEVGCRGGGIYTAVAKTNRAPQNTNTAVCPPSPSPTRGRSHWVRRDGRTDGRAVRLETLFTLQRVASCWTGSVSLQMLHSKALIVRAFWLRPQSQQHDSQRQIHPSKLKIKKSELVNNVGNKSNLHYIQ